VKLATVLSRLVILSLAAAAFAGLTGIYGRSVEYRAPDPQWQVELRQLPSAPQLSQFPEFFGEGMAVALFAVIGRIGLRLRLSPVSRSEDRPILLGLHRGYRNSQSARDLPSEQRRGTRADRP
jgi:hypothetical protein